MTTSQRDIGPLPLPSQLAGSSPITHDSPRDFRDVVVIMPVLDEAASLPGVLRAMPAVREVLVVDNGSTDGSAEVARAHGATVISEPRRGYGSAVRAGLTYLTNNPPAIVVILDADHADRPELLHRLVLPLRAGRADLALSDRTRTAEVGALTPVQVFGNGLAVRLMRISSGVRHRDMGPFRALTWGAAQQMNCQDPTWGWNVEMALLAKNRGLTVIEVPMPYRRRRLGHSKISGTLTGSARAGVRILQAVLKYRRA